MEQAFFVFVLSDLCLLPHCFSCRENGFSQFFNCCVVHKNRDVQTDAPTEKLSRFGPERLKITVSIAIIPIKKMAPIPPA